MPGACSNECSFAKLGHCLLPLPGATTCILLKAISHFSHVSRFMGLFPLGKLRPTPRGEARRQEAHPPRPARAGPSGPPAAVPAADLALETGAPRGRRANQQKFDPLQVPSAH